ncbi:uncharacterized protein LOC105420577 [Amborella trichopoda]|uniref:uncharacterized protein LOC105420577 n=1 Tax=Amborella trichopoda TaxID=13333 RepID=UPI0009BE9F94|nr:uncharacterized protein LOC105420577 [Amborella trichopoda]|eukprot:XP_020522218.1 uncharacterized protein LOC105420577 [Amborella trichopoda]
MGLLLQRSRLLFLIFTVVIEGFVGLQTTLVTDLGFASRNGLDIAYDSRSLGSGQGVHVKGTPDGSYMVPYENANGVSVAADNDARHRSADIQGTGPCTKEHQGVATDLMILGCWVSLESGPSVCTMQSEHVISAGHLGAVDYTHKSVIAGEHVDLGLDHHVVDGSHKSTSNCADKVIMDREGAGFHGFDIENTRGEARGVALLWHSAPSKYGAGLFVNGASFGNNYVLGSTSFAADIGGDGRRNFKEFSPLLPGSKSEKVKVATPTNCWNLGKSMDLLFGAKGIQNGVCYFDELEISPTETRNGRYNVKIGKELVDSCLKRWDNCLLGYFLGCRPEGTYMKSMSQRMWTLKNDLEIFSLDDGFLIFKFHSKEEMEIACMGGRWFVNKKCLIL